MVNPAWMEPHETKELDLYPAARAKQVETAVSAPKRRRPDGMHDAPLEERRAFSDKLVKLTRQAGTSRIVVIPIYETWLCDGCPGKGDSRVDFAVNPHPDPRTIDSFKQARERRMEASADEHETTRQTAQIVSEGIRYYDAETDEFDQQPGDFPSAVMGAHCAERFKEGNCDKPLKQILEESEVD